MTDAEKRQPFTAHTPLLFVSFQGLWEGRGEARGLEVGNCVLENGLLAGWEVEVPDSSLPLKIFLDKYSIFKENHKVHVGNLEFGTLNIIRT